MNVWAGVCTCVPTYIFVCAQVCAFVYLQTYLCGDQRLTQVSFLWAASPHRYFGDRVSHWPGTSQIDWPVSSSELSIFTCSVLGLWACATMLGFVCECRRLNLGPHVWMARTSLIGSFLLRYIRMGQLEKLASIIGHLSCLPLYNWCSVNLCQMIQDTDVWVMGNTWSSIMQRT